MTLHFASSQQLPCPYILTMALTSRGPRTGTRVKVTQLRCPETSLPGFFESGDGYPSYVSRKTTPRLAKRQAIDRPFSLASWKCTMTS